MDTAARAADTAAGAADTAAGAADTAPAAADTVPRGGRYSARGGRYSARGSRYSARGDTAGPQEASLEARNKLGWDPPKKLEQDPDHGEGRRLSAELMKLS